jgi:hypothetical protein
VTDWLLVMVPLLVLPVVLMFGFAGCALILGIDEPTHGPKPDPPAPPTPPTPPAPPTPPTPLKYDDLVAKIGSLRGWWRLGDATPPVARDSASMPHDGTYTGGVTLGEAGPPGIGGDSAALFDGATASVEVAYAMLLNPPDDFSVELWVKPGSVKPTGQTLMRSLDKDAAGFRGFALGVFQDNSKNVQVTASVGDGTPTPQTSQSVLSPGAFHHVVLTYQRSSGTLTLYVDAVSVGTKTNVAYVANAQQSLFIGSGGPTGSFFNGHLDEVAVYGEALALTEIQLHHKTGATA